MKIVSAIRNLTKDLSNNIKGFYKKSKAAPVTAGTNTKRKYTKKAAKISPRKKAK